MGSETIVYAHGNPAMPVIVNTLNRAQERALADAARRGQAEVVMLVDLGHPERHIQILGHAHPDGRYVDAEGPDGITT
ncbi:MAG TPA: hypothetical protein VN108_11955 [Marmoricola sp.]|nr:hypothetical protein [Marmoricola sp.]